ncbi:hypothetical protein CKN73_00655 [Carnobacterium divergens]|uniref:N-acetylmuramoyl-L-alanine amidase n=1 Tax=Carnobacterium divergens TaxID=2748 RepID=UPI0010716F69|nr:N-acetylmuramoyl-L-alanine amidase [Carnobacterium divergens]TFJ44988.1 hypothetical protein CKN77_00650 [Carnobacterium divergens]TFJ52057.1 hypothetical protein CKN73_00655 [Carnobacterium divergens]TFJ57634.1 hypothetical protein CKN83_00650 [Carnobacterium divergens]TFJ65649.1 hypothetical protein CKN89_00655 [Carnobacterium divergens]TFJ73954.1 hypothetical protein CKN91_00650 [Carnobacterium divergens]
MKNKKITLSIVFVILMSVLFPSLSTVVYATETKVNDLTTEQSAGIDNNNSSKKIDNELSEKESLEPNTEEVQTNQSTEINKEALKSQDDLRNETMSDVMKKAASIPSFIEEISGAALNLANSNDLYSSVMIAQAILESKYGTSELGSSPVHNLFGIKGTYNGQYVMKDTLEVINGETVTVNAQFRKYPSYTESLQDYVNKLKLGPGSENGSSWSPNYYSGAWKSNTQSYKDATKFLTGKYASDLNYNTKLDSLIQTYQLTRFDNPGTAKIISNLETPEPDTIINEDKIFVKGWALSTDSVKDVSVSLNGKSIGTAEYGKNRPDVYNAYPQYNNQSAGYEYNINSENMVAGTNKLKVTVSTDSGQTSETTSTISVPNDLVVVDPNLPNILTVDTLTNGIILKDNMIIKGWGLSASQVKKVEMLVDGKAIGEAQLGIERLDVEHFNPQYKNKNSGYSYQLDLSQVSEGKHVFTVKMTTGNGQVVENKYNVEKPKVDILSSIDSPQRNESISGIYKIRGWAIASEKISTVKVAVDGKEMGVATYGLQRDDVYHAYPSFNQKNGGYEYQLDTSTLTGGNHELELITTTVSGKTATYRIDMKISILDYRSQLDTPKSGGYISKNQLIKGWVLNKSEVKSISASINDNFVGNATVKLSRPDVGNAYPEYNNANSGFELKLTNANLKAGLNTLKLKIMFMDGSEKIISTTATYSENLLPITGSIDEPGANQANNSNDMLVRGWFLAEEGIDQVDVYVDNVYQGKANYGQLRTDVSNAYPQYKNANSGYNLSVSTKGLSAGKHTVKVIATSNVSGTKTYEQSFLRGGLAGRKVFVDPGHGGTDPGAISGGVQEKDLNLSVSLKLQALLESKGAEVIMSRTGDQFIPLSTISSKANASNADIFVSVHTNSAVASASGIETYSYSGTSRSVGMFSLDLDKQNESLSEGGFSTFGIDRLTKSVKLSEFVQKSMINSTGAVDRGAKKQDFHVIRETNMPAILTEIGFVTNPSERAKLVSDWYQNQLATGIFNGVDNYFKTN